jgi:hypothetical protein
LKGEIMTAIKEKLHWSHTYRFPGLSIYAWERLDRGGRIFVKFAGSGPARRDNRRKELLGDGFTLRDSRGRIDKKRVRLVEAHVTALARELLEGKREQKSAKQETLSLTEGFDLALDLERGKYPTKTRRWDAVQHARLVVERVLGKHVQWIELTHGDLRKLWRTLAEEARRNADGRRVLGARKAESIVDALLSVAAWLREESLLPDDTLLPMTHWRKKLKEEWTKITGATVRPVRHRHTVKEMRALFRSLPRPSVDPRFSLAFQLGGEQRIGQILKCKRSDLELTPFDMKSSSGNPARFGILRVPSAGWKLASPVMFGFEDRKCVDAALAGYLSLFEEQWRNGSIDDYPLFPAGRLKKGKAKLSSRPTPLTRDAARKMFQALERIAGVAHVPGRGWYGVRRIAADIAEDLEKDERVLNSLTGHRDSRTRQTIYQDEDRPEVLARAAQTRLKVRSGEESSDASAPAEMADAS